MIPDTFDNKGRSSTSYVYVDVGGAEIICPKAVNLIEKDTLPTHKIESGFNISDHIFIEPLELVIRAVVDPATKAKLEQIRANKQLIKAIVEPSQYGYYDNMAILELRFKAIDRKWLETTIHLKEVQITFETVAGLGSGGTPADSGGDEEGGGSDKNKSQNVRDITDLPPLGDELYETIIEDFIERIGGEINNDVIKIPIGYKNGKPVYLTYYRQRGDQILSWRDTYNDLRDLGVIPDYNISPSELAEIAKENTPIVGDVQIKEMPSGEWLMKIDFKNGMPSDEHVADSYNDIVNYFISEGYIDLTDLGYQQVSTDIFKVLDPMNALDRSGAIGIAGYGNYQLEYGNSVLSNMLVPSSEPNWMSPQEFQGFMEHNEHFVAPVISQNDDGTYDVSFRYETETQQFRYNYSHVDLRELQLHLIERGYISYDEKTKTWR